MSCISDGATMPIHYGDLLWQEWSGGVILRSHHIATSLGTETFTAVGSPWIPQEWLFSVATTMTNNPILAGVFGVTVGSAVAAAIGLAIYRTWDRSSSSIATSIAIVLITAIIVPFESLRAEHLAWFFLSLALLIIEIGDSRIMLLCLLLSVIWANIHGSVILLPILLVIRALSYLLNDKRFSKRVSSTLAFALATLLCSWINPVGFRLTTFAFDIQKNVALMTHIHEWEQPSLTDPIVDFIVLPLLVYGVIGTVSRRKWWDLLLIATFGFLSFRSGRHIALFAIAAAPAAIAAFSLKRPTADITSLNPIWVKRYTFTLSAVLLSATLLFVFFTPARVRGDTNVAYAPASAAVLSFSGSHRVFCQDFTWCSTFLGHPRFRVWWDGRADAYPADVWQRALEITADQPRGASERNLDRFAVDVVIAKDGAAVNAALAKAHWILVADLQKYRVWRRQQKVRNTARSAPNFYKLRRLGDDIKDVLPLLSFDHEVDRVAASGNRGHHGVLS
jgi:hypothetical protein